MEDLTQTKNPANTTKWIGVISDKQKKKKNTKIFFGQQYQKGQKA